MGFGDEDTPRRIAVACDVGWNRDMRSSDAVMLDAAAAVRACTAAGIFSDLAVRLGSPARNRGANNVDEGSTRTPTV